MPTSSGRTHEAGGPAYRESFLPGSFQDAVREPHGVLLDFEHHVGIGDVLGHALQLRKQSDGLHGSFAVHDDSAGDKALRLVRDGVLGGVSMMFQPLQSRRTADGVVERVRVFLDRVSLCRSPAYEDAQVLVVRGR
jgi:HK97 family phage prohead protease